MHGHVSGARRNDVMTLVLSTIEQLNAGLGYQNLRDAHADTEIYGGDSPLDSLSLVLLVSAIEEALHDQLAMDVVLASEKAMSMHHSPYRTIGSLVRFIEDECVIA